MRLFPFEHASVVIDTTNADALKPLVALQYTHDNQCIVQVIPFGFTSCPFLKDFPVSTVYCAKTDKKNLNRIMIKSSKGQDIDFEFLQVRTKQMRIHTHSNPRLFQKLTRSSHFAIAESRKPCLVARQGNSG